MFNDKAHTRIKGMKEKDIMPEIAYDWMLKVTDGNPGALAFVLDCIHTSEDSALGLMRMEKFNVIGEYLYVLWNDCCSRDTEKAIRVMINNSKEDILEHLDGLSRERHNFKRFE